MKLETWERSYTVDSIPKYPCPKCGERILKLSGKVEITEPAYSEAAHSHEEFEFDWAVERASFQLKCDDKSCGEIVNVIGKGVFDYIFDEEYGDVPGTLIWPTAFYPAPPLIEFPKKTPRKVREAAEQAFQVCWADTGSAANRIRVSVEYALDELNVPRTIKAKKSGKDTDLDLNGRIQWLEKQTGSEAVHASTFNALRVAGNAGSHGADDVSWENLLSAFLLYEAALEDVFGSRSEMLEKAKENLMKLKKSKTPQV